MNAIDTMDDITYTVTVWPIWINQAIGLWTPMRRVLRGVSWFERSIETAVRTGNILQNPATIRVFAETSGLTYIPPHEWLKVGEQTAENPFPEPAEELLKKYWTVDLTLSPRNIAPFESDVEFPNQPLDGSGTIAQQVARENSRIVRALNDFRNNTPGVLQILERNDNSLGEGSHIRLGAR